MPSLDPAEHIKELAQALAQEEREHQRTRERAARLEKEITRLRADANRLTWYSRHHVYCLNVRRHQPPGELTCSCGLDDLLTRYQTTHPDAIVGKEQS